MRTWIAVVVVCLALGSGSVVEAQEDEPAPGSVEMSFSISPTFLLTALQLGGSGPIGALGSVVQPVLDVGFVIDPRILFVVGVMAAFDVEPSVTNVDLVVPVSLLWYLDTPRVGHVMPMFRIGALLGYEQSGRDASYQLGGLARGGITWLADRYIGIRAELGLRGSVWAAEETFGMFGLDALVGVVLRV